MSTDITYPHLTRDADGTARIGKTRYKVKHLAAEHYQHGWSAEELMRQHPDLRPEQVYMALVYFHDHYSEMLAEIQESGEQAARLKPKPGLSRDELLRRKASLES